MSDQEFLSLVTCAELRVAELDKVDGYADRYANTILAAMEAGIKIPESGALFDAFVMLRDVVKVQQQLRRDELKKN